MAFGPHYLDLTGALGAEVQSGYICGDSSRSFSCYSTKTYGMALYHRLFLFGPADGDDDDSSHGPDFDTYRPSSGMRLGGWGHPSSAVDYDTRVQQIQVSG